MRWGIGAQDFSLDSPAKIALALVGALLTVLVMALVGAVIWRIPLGASNTILRATLQDYKEAAILTEKQKTELNDTIARLEAELDESKARNEKLERSFAQLVQENQAFRTRITDLEAIIGLRQKPRIVKP